MHQMHGLTMQLDRSHLELLTELLEHHTLADAAASLNLSPSAASRRLQEATRRTRIDLVEVNGRTLRLTAAGRLLAEAASDTTQRMTEAEQAARWLGSGHSAPIRVGIGFIDRVGWLLPRWDAHPFEILRSPTALAYDTLTQRRVDVTIGVSGASDTVGTTVATDELVLVVAADQVEDFGAAADAPSMIGRPYVASDPSPRPGFEFEEFFLPARQSPGTIVQVESLSVALDVIASSIAVSMQPRLAIEHAAHPGVRAVPLQQPVAIRWFVVTSEDPEPAVESFVAAVVERGRQRRSV